MRGWRGGRGVRVEGWGCGEGLLGERCLEGGCLEGGFDAFSRSYGGLGEEEGESDFHFAGCKELEQLGGKQEEEVRDVDFEEARHFSGRGGRFWGSGASWKWAA